MHLVCLELVKHFALHLQMTMRKYSNCSKVINEKEDHLKHQDVDTIENETIKSNDYVKVVVELYKGPINGPMV